MPDSLATKLPASRRMMLACHAQQRPRAQAACACDPFHAWEDVWEEAREVMYEGGID